MLLIVFAFPGAEPVSALAWSLKSTDAGAIHTRPRNYMAAARQLRSETVAADAGLLPLFDEELALASRLPIVANHALSFTEAARADAFVAKAVC